MELNLTNHTDHLGPDTKEPEELECIILAGGLGTRLRSEVTDLPKCMAPVGGKPFLQYLIDYLVGQGVTRIIFSVGYLHQSIESFVQQQYPHLHCHFSLEQEPLGTGGAIKHALQNATQPNVLILNGDTFFFANLKALMQFHHQHNNDCTLSLKPMKDFDRYGVVEINQQSSIQSFREKKFYSAGLINGGVYALNVSSFRTLPFPEKFSFEQDYLEKFHASHKMMGIVQDSYFIDIGIPEDYHRAQLELPLQFSKP